MPDYGVRITEQSELDGVSIANAATGGTFTESIDVSRARRWLAEVVVPTLTANAKVDFGIYWTANTAGTAGFAALGTGFQIAQESTGGKVFQLEFTTDSITNAQSTVKWIRGYTQVGTASAGNVTCTIRGFVPRFLPGVDQATEAQAATLPSLV